MLTISSLDGSFRPIAVHCGPTVGLRRGEGLQFGTGAAAPGTGPSRPCCAYLDVSFAAGALPTNRDPLIFMFSNYYVSSIVLTQQQVAVTAAGGQMTNEVIIYQRRLMANAYSEVGAQDTFSICSSDFAPGYRPEAPLRFHLFQPSPAWASFDLRGLACLVARDPEPRLHPVSPHLGSGGFIASENGSVRRYLTGNEALLESFGSAPAAAATVS